jgi:hypothetical protein
MNKILYEVNYSNSYYSQIYEVQYRTVYLLPSPWPWQLNCVESLDLPGYSVTLAMLREMITETQCVCILLLWYTFYLLPGSGFDFATIAI